MKKKKNLLHDDDSMHNDGNGAGLEDVDALKKLLKVSQDEIEKLKAENQRLAEENELLKSQLKQSTSVKQCGKDSLSRMELMVLNHDDPVAFIAQLKHNVSVCKTPKEKMRVLLRAIEANHLPVDLPYKLFDEMIEHIARSTCSNWMKTLRK